MARISTIRTVSVINQAVDANERPLTLIGKLVQENNLTVQYTAEGQEKDGYLQGVKRCIEIVKQHSDWISVDERLPYAEEMLTNHYEPKEFYEIILKTGELLIASYTHIKNDGNNEILFIDCTIALTDGEWVLLDGGFSVYEVDEVAYWKPIKPPSEV